MDHAPIVAERFDSACRAHYFCVMSVAYNDLRRRVRCAVTFEACLPRKAKELPSGPAWIHEIKHDGFRILAQKVDAPKMRRSGDHDKACVAVPEDYYSHTPVTADHTGQSASDLTPA
jgi:hypothetical protein